MSQLATLEEARELASLLGSIGGGVVETYVPEYGGGFDPPENGKSKFLHFRFANGAEGVNVGLIRLFRHYNLDKWREMVAEEVEQATKRKGA